MDKSVIEECEAIQEAIDRLQDTLRRIQTGEVVLVVLMYPRKSKRLKRLVNNIIQCR
jgi:hypothetical protein